MAEFSIRQMVGCLQGVGVAQGPVSLLRDFFGYRSVPKDSLERAEDISVGRQAARLRGPHFHLNLILVGEMLNAGVHETLDQDIAYARRLLGGAGIGIGRIKRFRIRQSDVDGFDELDSGCEAADLWESFSSPEEYDGIDVFVVRTYQDDSVAKGGRSPVDGSCDKNGADSGVVIVQDGGEANLVHEVGHYLGLDHPEDDDNVNVNDPMHEGIGAMASAHFSTKQVWIMRNHCMMRRPCP